MPRAASAVLAALTEVAEGPARERAAAVDRDRTFPRQTLDALADAGALGLLVPPAAGGAGGALTALAEACEALGAACASTGMVFLMHSVTAATVAAGGGDAGRRGPRRHGRRPTCSGRWPSASAAPAPTSTRPELRAERDNGGGARQRAQELRDLRRAGGRHAASSSRATRATASTATAVDARRGRRRASTARGTGLGMAGNSSVAHGARRRRGRRRGAHRRGGRGRRPRLRRRRAVLPGRARRGQRRHRRRRRRAAAAEHAAGRRYPDGTALAEIQTIQHALADMDLAVARARGCSCARPRALGDAGDAAALVAIMEAKVAATEAGPRGHPAGARGLRRAGRTRRRCRSSVTCATRAPARSWRRPTPCCAPGSARRSPACRCREPRMGELHRRARSPTTRGRDDLGAASATYFADAGLPTDYVLYSNYERLVDARARRARSTSAGTRTPRTSRSTTASAARRGSSACATSTRTSRRCWSMRRGEAFERARRARRAAARARQPRLRSRRDPAAALPRASRDSTPSASASWCASTPTSASTATPATPSCGCVRAVARRRGRRGRAGRRDVVARSAPRACRGRELEVVWRSPTYYHCNFTALDRLRRERREQWSAALLAMDYDDPSLRPAMELEGVRRWLPGDTEGYAVADGGDAASRGSCGDRRAGSTPSELELGGGLEVLVAAALEGVPRPARASRSPTPSRAVALELPGWARISGHEVAGERAERRRRAMLLVRCAAAPARACSPGRCRARRARRRCAPAASCTPATRRARRAAARARRPGRRLRRRSARSPRRARPATRWPLSDRDRLWADDVAELVEQASAHAVGRVAATSRGRPRAACPTTSSAPSPRS